MRFELKRHAKIWSEAPHCAFPDLKQHGDEFYLALREGRGHCSTDGRIRILGCPTSLDPLRRDSWHSITELSVTDHDLRDPCLAIISTGAPMVSMGCSKRTDDGGPTEKGNATFASAAIAGSDWINPQQVTPFGAWIWRTAWNGGRAFGFSYGGIQGGGDFDTEVSLWTSSDGFEWALETHSLLDQDCPTEVALSFSGAGQLLALARHDRGRRHALIGRPNRAGTQWAWKSLGRRLDGPCLLERGNNSNTGWLAAGRLVDGDVYRTQVLALDANLAVEASMVLPSAGDTSYPSMIPYEDDILVAYYSSHRGSAAIYLAQVAIYP